MIALVVRGRFVGPNIREHHFARKRRVAMERAGVAMGLLIQHGADWKKKLPPPPYVVTFTRCGKRFLDEDNLQGSLKSIRDEVAAQLGLKDGPRDPITWRYQQQASMVEDYRVLVEIAPAQERVI